MFRADASICSLDGESRKPEKQMGDETMRLSTPISARYLPALKRALVWQAILIWFSALILDHFYTNHVVVVAAVAHWIAIGMILIRRPGSPTSVDLFVCRAYPLVFGIAMLLAPRIMGGFMGGLKHRTLLDRWFGFDLLQDGGPAGLLFGIAALILAVALDRLKSPKKSSEPVSEN